MVRKKPKNYKLPSRWKGSDRTENFKGKHKRKIRGKKWNDKWSGEDEKGQTKDT